MAHLARILVYPIKSLDAWEVPLARVLPSGALEYDRRLALVDSDGNFVNGKRTALVHPLRSQLRAAEREILLDHAGDHLQFHLDEQRPALEAWFSDYFGLPVKLAENPEGGFPDDLDAHGPTVISTATLETVAGWFAGISVDEIRRRLRANLEIGGVEPFWEDRLYGKAGEAVLFRIGEVTFVGSNPCQRCVVPSRDSHDGSVWPEFSKTVSRRREATLPAWAERSRFNHFYRLAVNTNLHGPGGNLRVGDEVHPLNAPAAPIQ